MPHVVISWQTAKPRAEKQQKNGLSVEVGPAPDCSWLLLRPWDLRVNQRKSDRVWNSDIKGEVVKLTRPLALFPWSTETLGIHVRVDRHVCTVIRLHQQWFDVQSNFILRKYLDTVQQPLYDIRNVCLSAEPAWSVFFCDTVVYFDPVPRTPCQKYSPD